VSHLELLNDELRRFQIELPDSKTRMLAAYCDELAHWNQRINLTALSGADLVRRLVVEPVWIARELSFKGSLVDIGSGNGSPAIPFEVVCHLQECHLIEARAKRAAFLRHLVATLGLPRTTVHRARFEEVAVMLGTPDWISLQAVALSDTLIDSFRRAATSTTTIVWITSRGARSSLVPVRTLTVPITGTQVFLYRLDLT
jgi:16S rRNA (guanine527-N7)-methyltransferase